MRALRVLRGAVRPQAPSRPEFVTATTKRITVKWQYEATRSSDDDTLFSVLSFHLQQQCDSDRGWTTVAATLEPGPTGVTFASSTTRPANSTCVFRVAATNANGVGPFSVESLRLRTRAAAPDAPQQPTVRRQPLVLTWLSPLRDGGSAVIAYDVQYRPAHSSTWLQGAASSVDIANRTFAFDAASLTPYTRYDARVRARNSVGASAYTEPVSFLTEYRAPDVLASSASSTSQQPSRSIAIVTSASRERAANAMDRYYIAGIARGGTSRRDGDPGLVILFPINRRGDKLPELVFFFTGGAQVYRVPVSHTSDPMAQIVAVDVYSWGAGGGSGSKTTSDTVSSGGGGAFARGMFRVAPADTLDVFVGGGGRGAASVRGAGTGGFHGGGDAGRGDFPGGGGGGASEVRVNGQTILVAAGGGGGGATDYCCAHGGGGGGSGASVAEAGVAPNVSTVPLGLIEVTHTMRDEYHFENILGDELAFTDARARHAHLDYGFAGSSADYSKLATGGTGASGTQPGRGGGASSYRYTRVGELLVQSTKTSILDVIAPLAAFAASSGRRSVGGKGQDSKEGGGGGGGGYYGGGGGGAGVDAGGGGGGSSFIAATALADLDAACSEARVASTWTQREGGEHVEAFRAQAVSATDVELQWTSPRFGYSHEVVGFMIEMANRSRSDDFRIVQTERATAGAVVTTVRSLNASSWYRFRVKVLFRDAVGAYSSIETVQTPAHALNVWRRVSGGVRAFAAEAAHAGLHFTDPLPLRRFPSPRRGHTLVHFDKHLLLFGGYARGYRCSVAHKSACILYAGVNNELWRFDLATKVWMEVTSTTGGGSAVPIAREKHSAVVVADRVLVFGGRTGDSDDAKAALNDLWELSVTSSSQRTAASLQDLETGLQLKDGKELLTIGSVSNAPGMCVASLCVRLRVTHTCAQTLHIQLFGPGPSTFPQRQQSDTYPVNSQDVETVWSHSSGFTAGEKRTTLTAPSARSFPVTLQRPSMFSANQPCKAGTQDITFESTSGQFTAANSGGGGASSTTTTTLPLEALSVFHQLSASGGWTLSISDTLVDGNEGTLESWDIAFVLAPCVTKFVWRSLNAAAGVTSSPPSPRFQHAAIVYGSSMFIYGGRSGVDGNELNDLYRLDYSSVTGGAIQWTQLVSLKTVLSAGDERRFYLGRTTLLTAYDLLSVGKGLRSPRRNAGVAHHFTSGLYVSQKSVLDDRRGWQRIAVTGVDDDDAMPVPRYWSASAFVTDTPRVEPGRGNAVGALRPRLYVFGGQDDTTLLDDFWQLELDAVAEDSGVDRMQSRRREVCDWRFANAAYQQKWSASCGATTAMVAQNQASECEVQTLLLHAWCSEYYQSVVL